MEVRELGEGRRLRRPSIDDSVLTVGGADLAGEFEHEQVHFDHGDQTEVHGRGSLTESVLENVDLSGATLHPLTLDDVRMERTELSNAVLREVVARRVELVRCRAVGLRADLLQVSDLYLDGCRLDHATLRITQTKGHIVFHDCTFREATVHGSLENVVFDHCDLTGTTFEAVAAVGCDLRSSALVGARGLLTLRGARITADQAVSVADRIAVEAGLRVTD